jgi:biotin transport system substrate-specific component
MQHPVVQTSNQAFWPQSISHRKVASILFGSLLITLFARLSIPVPFSPVPITGQTFAVLLVGALLGSRAGAASVLAYLAEGAAGLPAFANSASGPAVLFGPTAGYLYGFVAAAFIVGWLCEHVWDRNVSTTAAAMIIGNVAIYLCGLPWLARFVGADKVLALGLLPFIAGDLLKIGVAVLALSASRTWIRQAGR